MRSSPNAAEELRRIVADRPRNDFDVANLLRRLEQFLAESEQIIPAAVEALSQGAIDRFGLLVDRSQRLAEELLENQIPQTMSLALHGPKAWRGGGLGIRRGLWRKRLGSGRDARGQRVSWPVGLRNTAMSSQPSRNAPVSS